MFVKISAWTRLEAMTHYQQRAGCHPRAMTLPPYYERVEVVTAGRGGIWDAGCWREVVAGDLIWNGPGDHTIGRSDFANPYRCLAVTLVARRKAGSGVPRFSRWTEVHEVEALTREWVDLHLDEEFDRQALFEHVVAQLLFRVRLHAHGAGRSELPPPLLAVVRKIERDYASACRLEELAAVAGWSVAHLHEVFRDRLQTTPHRMVLRRRMRAARERLSAGNQPVKQIAFECGFGDPAAFTHAFKAGTGMTPREYRERSLRPAV